jgi:hypothetical protein
MCVPLTGTGVSRFSTPLRDHHAVRHRVRGGRVAEEAVEVDPVRLPLAVGVAVERVVAGRDAVLVHRRPAALGLRQRVMRGEQVLALHPPALADVHLPREVAVVRVLVPGQPPFPAPLAELLRQRRSFWAK